jgi:hypothetical protein
MLVGSSWVWFNYNGGCLRKLEVVVKRRIGILEVIVVEAFYHSMFVTSMPVFRELIPIIPPLINESERLIEFRLYTSCLISYYGLPLCQRIPIPRVKMTSRHCIST